MFNQKYRAFPSAYWESSSSTDLERSDRLVLPTSALTALTQCKNVSFPVLLKITCMDISNTTVLSEYYSYVIDYTAPEGLLYLSSNLIRKLGIDQSGKSIVDVSLPSVSELSRKCPMAKHIALQPSSMSIYNDISSANPIPPMIMRFINEHFSILKVSDIIEVFIYTKKYEFRVTKLYTINNNSNVSCVRFANTNNSCDLSLIAPNELGFHNIRNADEDHKQPQDYMSDSEEWEIISIEKVQSPELIALEKSADFVNVEVNDMKQNNNNNNNVIVSWTCSKCSNTNEMSHKFCPKCGNPSININNLRNSAAQQRSIANINNNNNKNNHNNINNNIDNNHNVHNNIHRNVSHHNNNNINRGTLLLETSEILNEGKYDPCEKRQSGWILKNGTQSRLKFTAHLKKMDGDTDVVSQILSGGTIEVNLDTNEQMYVLLEIKAPAIPGSYHVFYTMIHSATNERICDVLDLPIVVKSKFNTGKENKIKKIIRMGFPDREKVIIALEKWSWDECKAANWLVTH